MRLPKWLDRVLVFALAVMALGGCAANRGTIGTDREALRLQIQTLETRLRTLESRAGQVSVAVKSARAAVAFVWGAYTFVDPTGRPLRHVPNEAGQPIADAQGVPLVDVTGTGAIAMTTYSGTAFLVGTAGELLTNRHIAEHWWENEESAPFLDARFRPVLLRLRAFFQERETGVPIEVLRVDPEQDIALARTIGWTPSAAPLPLHPDARRRRDGSERTDARDAGDLDRARRGERGAHRARHRRASGVPEKAVGGITERMEGNRDERSCGDPMGTGEENRLRHFCWSRLWSDCDRRFRPIPRPAA